jgi:capsular exopolysaccharide synthesis family protein
VRHLLPLFAGASLHPVDLVVGLIVGFLLAAAVILMRGRAGPTRGREDVAGILDRPVLATIPPNGGGRRRQSPFGWRRRDDQSLITLTDPGSSAAESYRVLRIHMARLARQLDVKTIMVTSAGVGEGKSTTASNLAVVLAESGADVLLVSADLRGPRVHEFFRLPNSWGLSGLLTGGLATNVEPGGRRRQVTARLWSVAPNLMVLPSGPPSPHPATLLDSDAMWELLKEQRDLFDFVILDCPSAQVVDSLVLAPMVDAVLVVADAKATDREALDNLRDQLDRVGGNLVGAVLNQSRQRTATWSHPGQQQTLDAPRSVPPAEPTESTPQPEPEVRPEPPSRPWEPEVGADTAAARLIISLLSLGCLAAGGLAYVLGVDPVRVGGLLVFTLLGVGSAPWQANRALMLPARLTLTMLTSLAVLTFVSVAMVTSHQWAPLVAFVVVAAACVPLHLAGWRLALRDVKAAGWRRLPQEAMLSTWSTMTHGQLAVFLRSRALLCATAGGVLCVGSAFAHRHLDPGFFGFLPRIGIIWYVGLGLILVAIVLSRPDQEHQIAVSVLLLLVVLTLTPALVYDGPRSQAAAKHVDLILQIRRVHSLDAAIDIYNSWPGFFAATAWLSDIAGIRDPMYLATFWPPLLGLFRLAALRYMFGQVLARPYQAWVAVGLAVLGDPIGADYFSPQSVGFVLGIAVFGLALSRASDAQRLPLILVAGWVLAMSHQLSPYGVGGVLVVLVLFKQLRPWWAPLLVLAPAVLWALMHRGALQGFLSWETIGRAQNFRPPKTVASPALERLPVVGQTVLALLVTIAIVGSIAGVALLRHRRALRPWVWACCPAVGLVLVAINPYGQEGIFRATLFGMPWLALLAGYCFASPHRRASRLVLLPITMALAVTFLINAFGLDAINVVRRSDVAAFRYVQRQSEQTTRTHYVLALGAGDLPTSLPPRSGRYQSIRPDRLKEPVRQASVLDADGQMRTLTARFVRFSRQPRTHAQLYVVWSPVASYYGWAYGLQSPDQFAALRDAFRRSPYWTVVLNQDGTWLFRFEPARYDRGAA